MENTWADEFIKIEGATQWVLHPISTSGFPLIFFIILVINYIIRLLDGSELYIIGEEKFKEMQLDIKLRTRRATSSREGPSQGGTQHAEAAYGALDFGGKRQKQKQVTGATSAHHFGNVCVLFLIH